MAETEKSAVTSLSAKDGSKIFTQRDAIFVSKDGSIVATTPTTLLIITSTEGFSIAYQSLFGNIPPLENPTISASNDQNIVLIRDPTMTNATSKVRLELDLNTLKVKVSDDDTVHTK